MKRKSPNNLVMREGKEVLQKNLDTCVLIDILFDSVLRRHGKNDRFEWTGRIQCTVRI